MCLGLLLGAGDRGGVTLGEVLWLRCQVKQTNKQTKKKHCTDKVMHLKMHV